MIRLQQIAAHAVGAQQVHRPYPVDRADEVAIHGDDPQQLVFPALGEERDGNLLLRIVDKHAPEREWVDRDLVAGDIQPDLGLPLELSTRCNACGGA